MVTGEVDEIQSSILSEKRTLNIYLPDSYKANDTATYPVVYLLDGGTDEDFLHIAGLYQFNSFPWINRVPPSIIIGIVNTDRKRDMTYPTKDTAAKRRYPSSGHSDKFINFIERELQPYVRKKFRINSSATIIGESLGGLLVTEILLKKPALFNNYIIVSPSLWWDNGSLLNQSADKLRTLLLQKTTVYIGVGKEGLTPGDKPRVMEVDANLLADKIRSVKNKNLTVYFDYLPEENHATIMHQAVFNAIRLMQPQPAPGTEN
ncbi:alpha/beta hydrolase-fold protein [Flavisolibacter ginsenosidimutans]